MTSIQVFHFQDDCPNFEAMGRENGFRFWMASDLARCLGYDDFQAFSKSAINRAIGTCSTLGIPVEENFVQATTEVGGKSIKDFRLSRFACYLIAMNGDTRKQQVAQAQAYFAAVAESFRQFLEEADDIERINIRDEVSGREKSLSKTAKAAGVDNYAFFQNAGYRGMYNMNLSDLKHRKGMPINGKGRSLLDYMGKTELAANLFRITQTEAKINNENITGQGPCEGAALAVGRKVRETMIQLSGTPPESLPLAAPVQEAQRNLKQTHRGFKKLDGGGTKKKRA